AKEPRGGPSIAEVTELREVNAQLTKEVKSLTQELLEAHKEYNISIAKLIDSLATKPSRS
ncbi:MAG: hypothetical protein Q8830_03715, partial [Candidatus Phytoplasma australasiaticum]|nr:hypothetical protein [Candidatus Phytoplasma australasiaticum]